MNLKRISAYSVFVVSLLVFPSGGTRAGEPKEVEPEPEVQSTCPVTGAEIDPDLAVEARGQRIGVCCPMCRPVVERAPEEALETLEEANQYARSRQTLCPVMEEPINPDLFVPFNGRRIYVCCETCLEKVREEPARYAQIVAQTVDPQEDEETAGAEEDKKDSAGAVEERPAQSTCPIMGFAVNKDLYADVKDKRVYVCCPPCRQKVKADPDAALKTIRKRGERAVDVPEGEGGGRDEAHER